MVYVGGILGLRWGECAGLRIQNLDFGESQLTVAEQLGPLLHGRRGMRPPKSQAGIRTMAVPRDLMTRLRQHLVAQGTVDDPTAFVFPGPGGRPLSYTNFRERVWNPACVAVGLGRWTLTPVNSKTRRRYAGLTFHDLRDSASTALVVSGVDPKTTQVRMGHADIATTLSIYARATRESDRGAADALEKYFLGGSRPAPPEQNDHSA
jgi:integrase